MRQIVFNMKRPYDPIENFVGPTGSGEDEILKREQVTIPESFKQGMKDIKEGNHAPLDDVLETAEEVRQQMNKIPYDSPERKRLHREGLKRVYHIEEESDRELRKILLTADGKGATVKELALNELLERSESSGYMTGIH